MSLRQEASVRLMVMKKAASAGMSRECNRLSSSGIEANETHRNNQRIKQSSVKKTIVAIMKGDAK